VLTGNFVWLLVWRLDFRLRHSVPHFVLHWEKRVSLNNLAAFDHFFYTYSAGQLRCSDVISRKFR